MNHLRENYRIAFQVVKTKRYTTHKRWDTEPNKLHFSQTIFISDLSTYIQFEGLAVAPIVSSVHKDIDPFIALVRRTTLLPTPVVFAIPLSN